MAISITSGYSLSANDSTPGVINYWILDEPLATKTPNVGGPITAFTTTVAADWQKFECADGEGDWTKPATAGSGGKEYLLSGNYRIGGLSEAKLDMVDDLLSSSRFALVAEHRDGKYYLLSTRANANTATPGSGVAGGGAAAVGSTIVFSAQDSERPIEVTVATTLDAITTP